MLGIVESMVEGHNIVDKVSVQLNTANCAFLYLSIVGEKAAYTPHGFHYQEISLAFTRYKITS